MNRPIELRLPLFLVGLLVGACSSQELPPVTGTGAPGGSGGNPGSGGAGTSRDGGSVGGPGGLGYAGAGGPGGDPADLCAGQSAGCVSSCTTAPFVYLAPVCTGGNWTCPDGSVSLATCDPTSCAQLYQDCCDDTTGAISPAPCSSDGQVLACPDGTRFSRRYCVPASLGSVGNCLDLVDTPCTMQGQRCYSSVAANCTCENTPGTDAGLAWNCPPFIP
jgi:hypothetical protein